MTYPFATAFFIFAVVIGVAYICERWRWAPAVPVVTAAALIIMTLLAMLGYAAR